jgi:hypothetical protein
MNSVSSQERSKLQTQTYLHHAIGISGFIGAIAYGRGGALIIAVSVYLPLKKMTERALDQ